MKTYNVTTMWAVNHAGDDIVSDAKLETALDCANWLKRWHDEDDIIICENDGEVGTYYSLPKFLKKLSKKEGGK